MSASVRLAKVKEVIHDFADLGGRILQISGGEPLLHPDLFEIIQLSKHLGLEVRLYTSGLLGLRARELRPIDRSFATRLQESGVDRIILNLQGSKAETHDAISRTPKSFQICLATIEACKSAGLWVGIHFVPMKPNYTELEELVALAARVAVDEVGILRFVPQGRGAFFRKKLELSSEEMLHLATQILSMQERYEKPRIRTGSPMNLLQDIDHRYQATPCTAGLSTCNITADGNIVPCPAFKKVDGFAIGSIFRGGLVEAWTDNPILENLRRPGRNRLGECVAQEIIAGRTAGEVPARTAYVTGGVSVPAEHKLSAGGSAAV
jgi:radical SAM protein with 4Fe4S-binding SPASM domain